MNDDVGFVLRPDLFKIILPIRLHVTGTATESDRIAMAHEGASSDQKHAAVSRPWADASGNFPCVQLEAHGAPMTQEILAAQEGRGV